MDVFTIQFEELYKAHYSLLRNTAHNLVSDPDAAHDIVQDVFLKLWGRKENPEHILNLRAYLLKAVVNTSLTYLQKNKHKVAMGNLQVAATERSDANSNYTELQADIHKAMQRLPPKCKTIFVLSRFEGLKNKDIAAITGLSLKTVENQMGIALKKMKEELKPYFSGETLLALLAGALSFGVTQWLQNSF